MRISFQAELHIWEEALRLAQRHSHTQGQAHAQTHTQGQTNTQTHTQRQTHTYTHTHGQTQGQSQNARLTAGGAPEGVEAGGEAGAAPCATPHTAAAAVLPTPASGAPQGAASLSAQPPLPLPLLGQHTAPAPGEARAAAGAVGGASPVTVDTAGTVHTVQRTHMVYMAPDTEPDAERPVLAHPTPPAKSQAALQGALPPLPPLPNVSPRPTLPQPQQAAVGDFFHLVFKMGPRGGGVGGVVADAPQLCLDALSGDVHGEGVETDSRKFST